MSDRTLSKVIERSKKIREQYHELELTHHGSLWTVEEDALAFTVPFQLIKNHGKTNTSSLHH